MTTENLTTTQKENREKVKKLKKNIVHDNNYVIKDSECEALKKGVKIFDDRAKKILKAVGFTIEE